MAKAQKNRASKQMYISQNQLTLEGFESPFSHHLRKDNRWVVLANKIPWDILVGTYLKQMNNGSTGADGINPRVAIGAMIIKHMCNLDDRETVQQIQENMYMQYFIGYKSFSNEVPFDPSLFVTFRKRLGIEQINEINDRILGVHPSGHGDDNTGDTPTVSLDEKACSGTVTHKGKLITDANPCPQDIFSCSNLYFNVVSNSL